MTRAEKAERNLIIRDEYIKGLSAKQLSDKYHLTEVSIYHICNGLTNPNNKGYAGILRDHSEEIVTLLNNGHNKKEIADKFNVTKYAVCEFTKQYGLNGKPNKNNETDVARKIKNKSNGLLEYVSGYTIKEKPVKVRCLVCGGEFERTFHNLTTKGHVTCPHCVERERLQLKEARDAEKERKRKEREAKAIERKAEEERKRAERKHPCIVCGTITDRPKYCCTACANKAANKTKEHRRRERIKTQMVDKDITVEGLFRRDVGKCWLCGERCNFEDYAVRDGNFIVGDWYPSIDHVIPLVKGGKHSWANVRLAHHRCNSIKHDKII